MRKDFIHYTPENEEAFFAQLERWNDEDEYTRCIRALTAIPKEQRDYRISCALARALENYAIIGDHDKGTQNFKWNKALLRAIQVLGSVRKEGQDRAEWNMRMAYAYQYLYGQEKKAIPYARRWAELDPEDENAPAVIRECEEKIAKRCETDRKGSFAGFVLLSKAEWDREQFIRDLREEWGIVDEDPDEAVEEEGDSNDVVVMMVGGMMLVATLFPYPIPGGAAEANAENNYLWPQAVEAAKAHKAIITIAVLGEEENLLEGGRLFTKALAVCCKQKYATGICTSGVVFEPRFYEGYADMMRENKLPIFNWIWFGLWHSGSALNACTYGMDVFGKDEIEVLDADAKPEDLRNFLAGIVAYVLENDAELHGGETIGFTKDGKHAITRSPGVSLPEEQMTLKISWKPSDGASDGDGLDDACEKNGEPPDEARGVPEIYDGAAMDAIGVHIGKYFGAFEHEQDIDKRTLEPSDTARAVMDYLDCECTYFPVMKDDDPIMSAYGCARREGVREGYIPVLIRADDETLLECLVMNSDPEHDADYYEFDPATVAEYRKKMLAAPVADGRAVLTELIGRRKAEAEDDEMDWEKEILGEVEGGFDNCRFASCWNSETDMTYPLILAKIPVKNPWEIFAYLPFGNWNECPDTPELMSAAKYWFEKYGAVPAVMTHDELEFLLPAPVSEDRAMELAGEQYGLCPDVVDQGAEDATVGALADTLQQSTVWYFWWD